MHSANPDFTDGQSWPEVHLDPFNPKRYLDEIANLRSELLRSNLELQNAQKRNQKLSDAILNSAEIIEELEEMKTKLRSSQNQAELAHQNTLQLSETIFERTHDAMVVLQEDSTCILANKNAIDLFQMDPKTFGNVNVLAHLASRYELDGAPWINRVKTELEERGVAMYEFYRNSEIEENWIELRLTAFSSQERQHYLLTGRDITSRKEFEERNRLLASVFENVQEGVVILDLDGNICEANPEFCDYVGLERNDAIGCRLSNIVAWDGDSLDNIMTGVLAGNPYAGRVNLIGENENPEGLVIYWGSVSVSRNHANDATNLIAMFSDITQIEETQKRLHRLALHDNLTGLPNRRFFSQTIANLTQTRDGEIDAFAVCFLDLDDFKIVNDTLGHDAGDQLLIEVAERIKGCIYRDCFLSRFGGDEFALLIPARKDPERIQAIAEKVVEVLNEPFNIAESLVYIGVSIGMTVCPDDATEVDQLLRHADLAMYHAKDEGKNTVRGFTPSLAAKIEAGQALLNDLRLAVANNDVTVVYQPKMCLRSRSICGCEALVRWTKDGKTINPAEFIDVAEKSGLILPLGDQIIEMVMRQAKIWREQEVFEGPIAINLSPRQLGDPEFIGRFKDLLALTETKAEWFELEITENAMVENLDITLKKMEELNNLGVNFAIDDFGTGYSSLNYLRTFPVSTLKIDLTFVRDLPHDARAVAVAKTVLSLGHGLGLNVVAEGVETQEQSDFLKQAGCDVIQGYLVDRPLSAADFAIRVTKSHAE